LTASATEEVGTSTTASTLSTSNHCRTTLEPMSGFLMVCEHHLDLVVALGGFAEILDGLLGRPPSPGPTGRHMPDWSFMTPILIVPSLNCARAGRDA
jgi:hypothetical protein